MRLQIIQRSEGIEPAARRDLAGKRWQLIDAAEDGTVTIRDDSGITGGGATGTVVADGGGGLDLTITEQFARSMSITDAMSRDNLLCYQMNDAPLPPEHGFPLRLIAPGWYGVANVKWLSRIEVLDRRFMGRFMGRPSFSSPP